MGTDVSEHPVVFELRGERLVGVLSIPGQSRQNIAVVFVVGGPQYRAGSHRQFTLLARHLAQHGIPAFRFDHRGIGDSEGYPRSFEALDEDIRCATDLVMKYLPSTQRVILWGLCDAASSSALYACADSRISGIVMLNPWVRTEEGQAKTYLRHHYRGRLIDRRFWLRLLTGKVNVADSIHSLLQNIMRAVRSATPAKEKSLPRRVIAALAQFRGPVLLILSGDDLTANEFEDLISRSKDLKKIVESRRFTVRRIADANHTFSRQIWHDQVAKWATEWLVETDWSSRL